VSLSRVRMKKFNRKRNLTVSLSRVRKEKFNRVVI